MEYIWEGELNEENKKNGYGKKYDFDDNIVFEGEYINVIRKKGQNIILLEQKSMKEIIKTEKDQMESYMIELWNINMN